MRNLLRYLSQLQPLLLVVADRILPRDPRQRSFPVRQASPQQLRRRAGSVVTLIGLGWLVLAGRLVQLQGLQHQELMQRADRQREYEQTISPRPGDIHDARGRLLATTIRAPSLFLVPAEITNAWEISQQVGAALSLSPDELYERLGGNADKEFLWVRRRLSDEEANRIRELNLPRGTWGFRDEYRRVYPQGRLAAHVLGLRDIDGIGRGGIEESFDQLLRGSPGVRHLTRDARGRVIDVLTDRDRPPQPGADVHLTIDAAIQTFAERELDQLVIKSAPQACCAIVMNPNTGDILAMASRPDFDPNRIEQVPENAWKNRAIADVYEPGSTFKPMMVAYGLDRGLLSTSDSFFCEWGKYRMGRRLLHDHHPYGHLSLTDVLVKSSNIGMAKVGERLTNEGLHNAATLFGFGRPTGIELPGELGGILRPLDEWTSYSTGSIPMGHELAATPLQLISAHAALANGGRLVRPRIALPVHEDAASDLSRLQQNIVQEAVAHWVVREPMRQVVTRGTGRKAQLPGVDVFGKTGTAQCLSPHGGYLHGKYISSFVCGAPAEDPQLLVLIVVNQAQGRGGETFGGLIAAPVASSILQESLRYLRVSPSESAPEWARTPSATRR